MRSLTILVLFTACSTWEKRFAAHVDCRPDEIKVHKRGDQLRGYQAHSISCKGVTYHCTEKMVDYRPTDLRCIKKKTLDQRESFESE